MAVPGSSTPSAAYGAVQLDVTAKLVMTAAQAIPHNTLVVQNLGPDPIYLGWDANVTEATGMKVAQNGGLFQVDICRDDAKGPFLYGIVAAAGALQVTPLDTRFWAIR